MCSTRDCGAPMNADPLLEVSELRICFRTEQGNAHVLDAVNLSIGRGRIMGLVGESGCGKTTLARAVLGILSPNAMVEGGSIRFDGLDLLRIEPERFRREVKGRRIAFVPQDPYSAFNPLFRVGDQIMEMLKWNSPRRDANERGFGALITPYPRQRYRADKAAAIALLNEVQIPDPERAFYKLPEQFSGGQRQRLMIAMALLSKPDLVIADEPTTALDVTIQAQILKLLKSLAKERGVSILLTTHDLGTAYEICDEITVMYAGQEVESAPVAAFFANPRHPYTARLLESLPDPARQIQEIGGEVPNLVLPPAGCRFHPRCASASAACALSRPPASGSSQIVRCFHPHAKRMETAR
jgi:peptide/nickel transport system ATP-binding protein